MKKLFVYLLILGYALSSPSFAELLKAPFIGIHYEEHHLRDPKLSFARFIEMHYMGKDLNDHDTERDMKLPFKRMVHSHSHVLFHNLSVALLPKDNLQLVRNTPCTYHQPVRHTLPDQLFRPPQLT